MYLMYTLQQKEAPINRRSILIWLIIGFALPIVGFFITKQLGGTDWETSFLISLLIFLIVEIFFAIYQFNLLYKYFISIGTFFSALNGDNRFHELQLIYGIRHFGFPSESWIKVTREEFREFWRDCVSRTKGTWRVVNYAGARDTWDVGFRKGIPFYTQGERINSRCLIERIFLLDSNKELEDLRPVMQAQKDINIKVSWVLRNELMKNERIKNRYSKLKSYDFAIVDDSWVYFTHLNRRRNISGSSATIEPTHKLDRRCRIMHAKHTNTIHGTKTTQ